MGDRFSDREIAVLYIDDLGPGNLGNFGPKTRDEEAAVENIANPEYVAPPTAETHCMDDRCEEASCRLPGSLLTSEVSSDLMLDAFDSRPLSQRVAEKTHEILNRGRRVLIHEDCAAINLQRAAMADIGARASIMIPLVMLRLEKMGMAISEDELHRMSKVAGLQAANEAVWDIDADGFLEVARQNGAEVQKFDGKHRVAGCRTDLSPYVFDNGAWRQQHKAADGLPLGVLSITPGAYKKQLEEDGFNAREVEMRVAGVKFFTVSIQKQALQEGAKDIIVA